MKYFNTVILLPLSEIIANGFIEQDNFRYYFTQWINKIDYYIHVIYNHKIDLFTQNMQHFAAAKYLFIPY